MALEAGGRLRKPDKFIAYSSRVRLGRRRMMISTSLMTLLASLSAWLGISLGGAPQSRMVVQRTVVRDQIIIHVPIAQRHPNLQWIERKGPKCLAAGQIAGAAMATPSTIDFVLSDRRRVRAKLDSDCAGLDFYGGFYVEPQRGEVCAKREEIRSRAGSTCRIEGYKALEPKYKR